MSVKIGDRVRLMWPCEKLFDGKTGTIITREAAEAYWLSFVTHEELEYWHDLETMWIRWDQPIDGHTIHGFILEDDLKVEVLPSQELANEARVRTKAG